MAKALVFALSAFSQRGLTHRTPADQTMTSGQMCGVWAFLWSVRFSLVSDLHALLSPQCSLSGFLLVCVCLLGGGGGGRSVQGGAALLKLEFVLVPYHSLHFLLHSMHKMSLSGECLCVCVYGGGGGGGPLLKPKVVFVHHSSLSSGPCAQQIAWLVSWWNLRIDRGINQSVYFQKKHQMDQGEDQHICLFMKKTTTTKHFHTD